MMANVIPGLTRLGEAFLLRDAAKYRYGATMAGGAWVGNPELFSCHRQIRLRRKS
jgi:hypothetical protein